MNTTTTKHSPDCRKVFARYDVSCPRCRELMEGLPARSGWGELRRRQEAMRCEAVARHNCSTARCGPVCTFGDW